MELIANTELERKYYAYIDFFKLLRVTELTHNDDDFDLIGGKELLNRLLLNIEEGQIVLQGCNIIDLYSNLKNLNSSLSSIDVSKSTLLNNANMDFAKIKIDGSYSKNIDSLRMILLILPDNARNEFIAGLNANKNKQKVKKID